MTTPCCKECDVRHIRFAYDCDDPHCKCHQTHTTKEGWEGRFDQLWETLEPEVCTRVKTHNTQTLEDYEPLASDDIKAFIASEITKAQVEVLEEVKQEIAAPKREMPLHKCDSPGYCTHYPVVDIGNDTKDLSCAVISDKINHIQQQNVPSNLSTNQSGE